MIEFLFFNEIKMIHIIKIYKYVNKIIKYY